MIGPHFSVILLPTNQCNVACDYCFEQHSPHRLTLEQLPTLTGRLLTHMEQQQIATAEIYWQGGELMTLPPRWFEQAHQIMTDAASARGRRFEHCMQTNLIGYDESWHQIIEQMFGNDISTSMDFPNVHRRLGNGSVEQYTAIWEENLKRAQAAGMRVGVIAVLSEASLRAGAESFYAYFVDHLGLKDFQVNTPFAGGPAQRLWKSAPLPMDGLCRFMEDLFALWATRGYDAGVRLGPFDALVDHFCRRPARLPCIWQPNCAEQFVSIDARGNLAQCDCWVTSYPEYSFGNVFHDVGLTEQLRSSAARADFNRRPERLAAESDCATCRYLSICHGGCPVRTYAAHKTLFEKDPYCEMYLTIFGAAETFARTVMKQDALDLRRERLVQLRSLVPTPRSEPAGAALKDPA